jgi:hypothetical protein
LLPLWITLFDAPGAKVKLFAVFPPKGRNLTFCSKWKKYSFTCKKSYIQDENKRRMKYLFLKKMNKNLTLLNMYFLSGGWVAK